MRLSDKDKKLLVLLLMVAILALTYYYVYTPFVKKLDSLRQEVSKLETDYNTLQGKSAQKNRLDSEMKIVRFELDKLNRTLPADILQDKVILILKELSDITGVKLEDLAFTESTPLASDSSQKKSEPTQQQKLLEESNPQTDKWQDSKGKMPENTGIVMEIKVKYTADYEQIKDFMAKVMSLEQKVTVSDISFSKSPQNIITGSLKLSFYGFKDSAQQVPGWESDVEQGKENIFEPFEGYIGPSTGSSQAAADKAVEDSQQESASIESTSDFYISLGPSNYDVPTAIIYQTGKTNTTIYGDGNGIEKLEFHVDYKNGKYLYKYKTSYQAYPKDANEFEEFIPDNPNYIILEIFSKDRLDAQDLAGADIDVYNNTPIKLIVKHKDDSQRPRAHISAKNGDVGVVNEH